MWSFNTFNLANFRQKRVWAMSLGIVALAILLGFVLARVAKADAWDKRTVVTFSAPVEIPGKILPAGTYVMKLLDVASTRNIVRIYDKDEKEVFATLLTIPDYRLEPTGETVIHFAERPADRPDALRAWFYPGDQFGQQFVYPKNRAVEIAKQSNQTVLTMPNELAGTISDGSSPTASVATSEEGVKALRNAEVTATRPSGESVPLSEAVSTAPAGNK
jgi:hypothetical protein